MLMMILERKITDKTGIGILNTYPDLKIYLRLCYNTIHDDFLSQ